MTGFFRFPHTPHLAWLGQGLPRDDKLLTPVELDDLLAGDLVIEEKLDGANLGLSPGPDGELRAQNRGQYLVAPLTGQFSRLTAWLATHRYALGDGLDGNLMLFGEWCAARHSLDYAALPDWFLLFDVYDRARQCFWSTPRRNALAATLGLAVVSEIARGRFTLTDLKDLLAARPSRYRPGPMEGLVVRRESADWCEARAKLVQADFTQGIEEHWRHRPLQWNQLAPGMRAL